jgi:hypothetical protein
MENTQTIPVILTGTLARNPRAELTADRTVECVLSVRPRHIFFAAKEADEPERSVYTIRVSGIFRDVLFLRASRGSRVIIPGNLTPGTARIRTDIVYNAAE